MEGERAKQKGRTMDGLEGKERCIAKGIKGMAGRETKQRGEDNAVGQRDMFWPEESFFPSRIDWLTVHNIPQAGR